MPKDEDILQLVSPSVCMGDLGPAVFWALMGEKRKK